MRKFLIIIFFLILISSSRVYAQGELTIPSLTPTPSLAKQEINYDLPYPGVLPGGFIYNLKLVRDKLIELTTTDNLRKSGFYLLQADKRLSASIMLFAKGKQELGETTLSKSQNYHEKALAEAVKEKENDAGFIEAISKIEASVKKQKIEIQKLIKSSGNQMSIKLEGDLKRAEDFEKKVNSLKPKNQQ